MCTKLTRNKQKGTANPNAHLTGRIPYLMSSEEEKKQGKPNVQKKKKPRNTVFAITRRDDEYDINMYGFS